MDTGFLPIDYIVFAAYGLLIVFVGVWISRTKKGQQKTTHDYFLASEFKCGDRYIDNAAAYFTEG